jgi:hypothetical protein
MGKKKSQAWEVIKLRANGEYLGTVEAPDKESALKAALKLFALEACEANRLLVLEVMRWVYGSAVTGSDPGISARAAEILGSIDFYRVGRQH